MFNFPDNKVHGANMGPNWGRQDPGGPHVGPVNLAFWDKIKTVKNSWSVPRLPKLKQNHLSEMFQLWMLSLKRNILVLFRIYFELIPHIKNAKTNKQN